MTAQFRLSLLLSSALAFLAAPRDARAFTHIVRSGDTLASIAEKYYGKIQYERILVEANLLDLEGGSSITRGMRLEVPALGHRRVGAGDSWDSLAEELLGSAKRSDVLALANRSQPWLTPEEGAEISVPYNLRVIVRGADTLMRTALKFLGDMNKAWVLDRYNGLKGKKPEQGSVLLVPLTDLPLTEEGKRAAAHDAGLICSESAGATQKTQRRVAQEIPLVIADVRAGRFAEAVARGNRLIGTGSLTEPQLGAVHRQLLEAYVALEATGLARASCSEWKRRDPGGKLDPMLASPKILQACAAPETGR